MRAPLTLTEAQEQFWMKLLLSRAERLGRLNEVPVSAMVVDGLGRWVGFGGNCRERDLDPLGHAELVAMRQAARLRGDWRMNDCTLLVTLEPCPMCAGALVQARMGQVIFGAGDPKRGAMGGTIDLTQHASAHHHMKVKGGVLEEEASAMLRNWFRQRRRRADGTSEVRSRRG